MSTEPATTTTSTTAKAKTITVPSYPLSKEESGNASWKLLHNSAAQLPETLDRSDRVEFSRFMNMIIRKLPCGDCQREAYGYLREKPPNFETRKDVMTYLCEFHNEVNQKLHKDIVPCASLVINQENCPTCGLKHNTQQESSPDQQTASPQDASTEEIPDTQDQIPDTKRAAKTRSGSST